VVDITGPLAGPWRKSTVISRAGLGIINAPDIAAVPVMDTRVSPKDMYKGRKTTNVKVIAKAYKDNLLLAFIKRLQSIVLCMYLL